MEDAIACKNCGAIITGMFYLSSHVICCSEEHYICPGCECSCGTIDEVNSSTLGT